MTCERRTFQGRIFANERWGQLKRSLWLRHNRSRSSDVFKNNLDGRWHHCRGPKTPKMVTKLFHTAPKGTLMITGTFSICRLPSCHIFLVKAIKSLWGSLPDVPPNKSSAPNGAYQLCACARYTLMRLTGNLRLLISQAASTIMVLKGLKAKLYVERTTHNVSPPS